MVQVYTEIRHNYWWFWHNELMWDYFFPESRTMNWGVINIHFVWRPMSLPESGMQKTWKSIVANQHGLKCVKCTWMIIWGLQESQQHGNWMRWVLTVNSYAIWSNKACHIAKLVHKVSFLKAIDCIVVCWSRKCKIAWWKYRRKKSSWSMWSIPKVFFYVRVILNCAIFVHYVLNILLSLSWNGSIKQFWTMELYGWSFQAPHCLTWTRTDGNIFFFFN